MINAVNDYYTKTMYEDMKSDFEDTTWKPFQQTILNICKNKADTRIFYIIEDIDKIKNGI